MEREKRRGLPGDLDREAYKAIRKIYLKYSRMKKHHMSLDRIREIIYSSYRDATECAFYIASEE